MFGAVSEATGTREVYERLYGDPGAARLPSTDLQSPTSDRAVWLRRKEKELERQQKIEEIKAAPVSDPRSGVPCGKRIYVEWGMKSVFFVLP